MLLIRPAAPPAVPCSLELAGLPHPDGGILAVPIERLPFHYSPGRWHFRVSARSLFNWQHQHPEFLQAIQEGRQRSLLWWERRALAMASGELGNTQIVMLGLRNRSRAAHGWNNDTLKVEHTGIEGRPAELDRRKVIDVARLDEGQRGQLRTLLLLAGARRTDEHGG